jgi:hypothetical protein
MSNECLVTMANELIGSHVQGCQVEYAAYHAVGWVG